MASLSESGMNPEASKEILPSVTGSWTLPRSRPMVALLLPSACPHGRYSFDAPITLASPHGEQWVDGISYELGWLEMVRGL